MKRSRSLRNIVTWRRAHAIAERRKRIVKYGGMIACGVVVVAFAVGNQIQAPYLETVLETVAVQSQQLYRSLASSPTQNASSQRGRDNPAPPIAAGNQPRVALVVGNGAYQLISALDNPSNDAVLIKRKLERVGFRTELVTDANKGEMEKAILDFGERLAGAGRNAVGLFYYAGHGVQSGEGNYLIPLHDEKDEKDGEIVTEKDLDIKAVPAQWILKRMKEARNALNIVILDACRNNPLRGRTRAASRGLIRMVPPPDTLVAYSAGPGQVAVDGEGEHSPFAAALATALDQPGLKVEEIFKSVRVKVLKDTENRQTPWEESSLTRDFYFRPQADELQGRPFTVVVDPAGARVRILNIRPPYRAGMKLPAGEYRVEASAPGHASKTEMVQHGASGPTVHRVELEKLSQDTFGVQRDDRFREELSLSVKEGLNELGFRSEATSSGVSSAVAAFASVRGIENLGVSRQMLNQIQKARREGFKNFLGCQTVRTPRTVTSNERVARTISEWVEDTTTVSYKAEEACNPLVLCGYHYDNWGRPVPNYGRQCDNQCEADYKILVERHSERFRGFLEEECMEESEASDGRYLSVSDVQEVSCRCPSGEMCYCRLEGTCEFEVEGENIVYETKPVTRTVMEENEVCTCRAPEYAAVACSRAE